jgi:hypothetical protein
VGPHASIRRRARRDDGGGDDPPAAAERRVERAGADAGRARVVVVGLLLRDDVRADRSIVDDSARELMEQNETISVRLSFGMLHASVRIFDRRARRRADAIRSRDASSASSILVPVTFRGARYSGAARSS